VARQGAQNSDENCSSVAPRAQGLAQFRSAEPQAAAGRGPRSGQPAVPAAPGHPERRRPGQDGQGRDKSAYHGGYSMPAAHPIPGRAL